MSLLVNKVSLESNYFIPLLHAISLNMAVEKNSTKLVDLSKFSWALKHKLSKTRGAAFDFDFQQDVEVLQIVLD